MCTLELRSFFQASGLPNQLHNECMSRAIIVECVSCRRAVDEAEVQFNAVRLKLAEAEAAKADLAASLKTARGQIREATEAQQATGAALSEARVNLDEHCSASSESAAALRAKEHRITQLQRQLTSQVGTCVRHAEKDQ